MTNQIEFNKIIIYMIVLYVFWNIIKINPELLKYDEHIRFNVYRSLMCLTFVILSIRNFIVFFKKGISSLYQFHHSDLDATHNLFLAYLVFDIIKLLSEGNKRWDLYLHHLWCIFMFLLYKHYNCAGYIISLFLIAEVISVVSGIDSIAMDNNNMYESYKYKKVRKIIIKYFRLPLWIVAFLINFKHLNKLPKKLAIFTFITTILMIGLDWYWEAKCDKVIRKFEK